MQFMRENKIYEILKKELNPEFLEVKNNSYLHKGHLGDDGSLETHFVIVIKCEELKKLTRIQAHQRINKLLKEEFVSGLHALEIKIL